MSKPIVILADPDYEGYLDQLHVKFIEEQMNDIELEAITDPVYFSQYFSTPRHLGVLIVSEDFYHPDLQKHNISNIFVLSEQAEGQTEIGGSNVRRLRKYSSVKSIYNAVVSLCPEVFHTQETMKITQTIVVSSPKGGAGKTTTALGVSMCLAESYKKVLYIDAEQIQMFQYFMESQTPLPISVMQKLRGTQDQILAGIKPYLRNEAFAYLPPFPVALTAAGLTPSDLLDFIKAARECGDYDYVIVDTDSVFDDFKASLFGIADRVFLITEQDAYSVFCCRQYLSNFNYKDSEKYLIICNRYSKDTDNYLLDASSMFTVTEYVESCEEQIQKCGQLTRIDGLQKLAYMLS